MKLIGLGGRLRAGKDAVADHLVNAHGFVKIGMSDALHEAMLVLDPYVEVVREHEPDRYSDIISRLGYVEAKKIPEVRRLLQQLGTEIGRKMIDENVWTSIVVRKVREQRAAGSDVVVTGLRFPNEIKAIEFAGGRSIWVERPDLEDSDAASHSSENSVSSDDFDIVLLNDGSLEQLYAKVDLIA